MTIVDESASIGAADAGAHVIGHLVSLQGLAGALDRHRFVPLQVDDSSEFLKAGHAR